jgi:hypothetical protein
MSINAAAAIRAKLKEIVPEYYNGSDALPEYAGSSFGLEITAALQFSTSLGNSGSTTRYPTPRF